MKIMWGYHVDCISKYIRGLLYAYESANIGICEKGVVYDVVHIIGYVSSFYDVRLIKYYAIYKVIW